MLSRHQNLTFNGKIVSLLKFRHLLNAIIQWEIHIYWHRQSNSQTILAYVQRMRLFNLQLAHKCLKIIFDTLFLSLVP